MNPFPHRPDSTGRRRRSGFSEWFAGVAASAVAGLTLFIVGVGMLVVFGL